MKGIYYIYIYISFLQELKTCGVSKQELNYTVCDPWLMQLHVDCATLFSGVCPNPVRRFTGLLTFTSVRFLLHRSPKMLQKRVMSFLLGGTLKQLCPIPSLICHIHMVKK